MISLSIVLQAVLLGMQTITLECMISLTHNPQNTSKAEIRIMDAINACQALIAKSRQGSFDKFSKKGLFKTVCYHGLGCFYTGPPFFQIPFRLLSLPPLPPDVIRTIFLLFTRRNKNNPVVFPPEKPELILKSEFNSTAWTRILIHGYVDGSYSTNWLFNAKDEILRLADDNVIILDDSTTYLPPRILYQQSVADTRLIGVQLANVVTFLKEKLGVDLNKVHVIGHSLGAHTAGHAGELVPGIGRITGLDPAGPYYRNVPRNVQLDETDAKFVDVIHSNPAPNLLLGLGTLVDGGHINFWPNGGIQRGCALSLLRVLFDEPFPFNLETSFNCRHQRAFEFFIYSFNQMDCLYVGVECTSWSDFVQGKCNCGPDGNKCAVMGMFATPKPPPRRRYYLQVAAERPYCLHQYQIVVFLKTEGNVTNTIERKTSFTMFGEKNLLQKELSLK
ncbi:pancreatic triacylglycerol lipase-like [Argiope bruennichi]|uniref:pancreatic triacylglycerol lipase-like n=1 Tax=Argiope bruennichi TaxID=94029 RepID=UPI002494C080|nr:pancreatic triacylglycerol lipase-like [Argiope bruennichi]